MSNTLEFTFMLELINQSLFFIPITTLPICIVIFVYFKCLISYPHETSLSHKMNV